MADEGYKTSDRMANKQENALITSKDSLANKFANDGSFMEMFKQRMNEKNMTKKDSSLPSRCPPSTSSSDSHSVGRESPEPECPPAAAPTNSVNTEQTVSKSKELKPLPFVSVLCVEVI